MHKVPDALSRMFDEDEIEVAEVGEITDQWYISKIQDIVQYPMKHAEWKVEDELLYKYKRDPLLDPISDGGKVGAWSCLWRRVSDYYTTAIASRPPDTWASTRRTTEWLVSIFGPECIETSTSSYV